MSDQFKGVQALIVYKYPTTIYVHWKLNVSNAAEVIPIRNAFGFLGKCFNKFALLNK